MVRKVFLAGLMYVPLCALSATAFAASGNGDIMVGILNPIEMSEDEARRLCAEESYLVKCDVVLEKVSMEDKEDIFPSSYSNDNFFDETEELDYRVFNANYE